MMFVYLYMSFLRDMEIKANIDEEVGSFGNHTRRICQLLVME